MRLGAFFILPLFLLCCSFFKSFIYEKRRLIRKVLSLDDAISEFPNVETINISVADCYLDFNKTTILERNLFNCRKLIAFKFRNLAGQVDTDAREYTDFPTYFSRIKQSKQFTYSLRNGDLISHRISNLARI